MENYLKTITKQLQTIEYCIRQGNSISASILLYALIDSYSWLCSTNDEETVKARFTSWVDDWLLPTGYPNCSALDLYGARCGLIHRLTGESNYFDSGLAKRIIYTYGDENEDFINSLKSTLPEDVEFYTLNLDKFLSSVDKAMTDCFSHVMTNEKLKASFLEKIDKIYVDVHNSED